MNIEHILKCLRHEIDPQPFNDFEDGYNAGLQSAISLLERALKEEHEG